jgi:Bacterial regulatory protein, Fis family
VNENGRLAYRVYSAIPRRDNGENWLNIGLAVPHRDGKGFDVMLEALPLNPKLVMRSEDHGQQPAYARELIHREQSKPASLRQQVEAFERALIEQCLIEAGGKVSAVIKRLDVPRRTLSEKIARLGIDRRRLAGGGDGANAEAAGESSNLKLPAPDQGGWPTATADVSSVDEASLRPAPPQPATGGKVFLGPGSK